MDAQGGWRDNYFRSAAWNCSGHSGGTARNRRRHRAGAGHDIRPAHGPASGAGNLVIHITAAGRAGRAPAVLESRERRLARGNFVRGGNDSGSIHRQQIRRANVHANPERIVWWIFDFIGGIAVDEGAAVATCNGRRGSGEGERSMNRTLLVGAGVLLAGTTAGIASGMFGIGGGVILVPILGLLLGFSQHRAQGTSLVALIPPTGLLAGIAYAHAGYVSWQTGFLLISGGFLGGIAGGRPAKKNPSAQMRRDFAALIFMLRISQH